MTQELDRSTRLALLIDADNASPRIAKGLFEEVASIGEASVRRIYGDFSGMQLKGWSEALAPFAIIPQQTPANTAGKNASDIAMVIDAMDLLHTGRFGGFCLVSSDGDFTRLAARIREQGADVYGFGERKTPLSFRQACKRFIYTENLLPAGNAAHATDQSASPGPVILKSPPHAAIPKIRTALGQLDDTDGWYFLGAVGNRLSALMPDFDARSYGCPKLVTLIERSEAFDIRRDNLMVYIRPRSGSDRPMQ
ncbi:MAG: NYN domain-containing protein [Sphingomonas sp.]|uniref:NYN domain-containing protein n=1 Tax=Sphingomonas sp. TaxID=28214 RepID=UPI0026055851|nr:NYN domain-containing protein [Sphingomonas sp.]MDK2768458.1 NYN domain-containing protein [Sphingomonas sp.]